MKRKQEIRINKDSNGTFKAYFLHDMNGIMMFLPYGNVENTFSDALTKAINRIDPCNNKDKFERSTSFLPMHPDEHPEINS